MSNQASTTDIASYLTEVNKLLSAGKYDFVPRRKNMQALAQHGLTIADAKNEILGLLSVITTKALSRISIQIVLATYGNSRRILMECSFT